MMYEEFNQISEKQGFAKVSYAAFEEAEEIYMAFQKMTKEQIVKIYWNSPDKYRHALKIARTLKNILKK